MLFPHSISIMWLPQPKDIKPYPHFDAPLPEAEIARIANDPLTVERNPFFPLLVFKSQWKPFRKKGLDKKERLLRYASRRDAAIYAKYRTDLSSLYEIELTERDLSPHVVGYRKIASSTRRGGKCNIDFAADAFSFIRGCTSSTVVVADISSFFESLDHSKLKKQWSKLLKSPQLPPDHFALFRHITRYTMVDRDLLYQEIGLAELKGGRLVFRVSRKETPKQLCDVGTFRELLGKAKRTRIGYYRHELPHGIPQGLPISDVLANIYMLDFDQAVATWCKE